jgi:DNA-binding CsgD family transcriptional regulator
MAKPDNDSARVTLRQICGLGLPASVLLPSLLPALRAIVAADHAAFFYCDASGHMVNMYAERMLPPDEMAQYYEDHYQAASSDFSCAFLKLVAAPDPVSHRSVSAVEMESTYYREVLSRLNVGHIMYAVIRCPLASHEPIGQLSLYRSPDSKAFNQKDADRLRDVLHYLGPALSTSKHAAVTLSAEQIAEEAMAVLTEQGEILFADAAWSRLIRLARGEVISPAKAKSEAKGLQEFLLGVMMTSAASRNAIHFVDSPWGKFAFRMYDLKGVNGSKALALAVSRLSVDTVRLTEGAARLALSAQQREVAVMIACGRSNGEIAEQLGISVNTAGYHTKQLFTKLGVHHRSEVANLLRQA